MNPGCTLIAFLKGQPEKSDERLAMLREFAEPMRAEGGSVEYHLHISDADPNLFFCDNGRIGKDLGEHLKMLHLKSFFDRRMDLLAGPGGGSPSQPLNAQFAGRDAQG